MPYLNFRQSSMAGLRLNSFETLGLERLGGADSSASKVWVESVEQRECAHCCSISLTITLSI